MKTTVLVLVTASAALMGGCASKTSAPTEANASSVVDHGTHAIGSTPVPGPVSGAGYDDRQIAKIKRGETTEAVLLEWFGPPESRDLKSDGRAHLTWTLSPRTDGGAGTFGTLNVSLTADSKVESYSARGGPLVEKRTEEFVEISEADLRWQMEQWRREGWGVLSLSARLPQADGTVRRRAELSRTRSRGASGPGYDDGRIGNIRRGETDQAQLMEWFGPAYTREIKPDGRALLAWNFGSGANTGSGQSGGLNVSLAPDGKVDAYSARRGPQ